MPKKPPAGNQPTPINETFQSPGNTFEGWTMNDEAPFVVVTDRDNQYIAVDATLGVDTIEVTSSQPIVAGSTYQLSFDSFGDAASVTDVFSVYYNDQLLGVVDSKGRFNTTTFTFTAEEANGVISFQEAAYGSDDLNSGYIDNVALIMV